MLAWTEEGRQILLDEFDVDYEDDDYDDDDDDSSVKALTKEEIDCLHELVKYLDLDKNDDPKYNEILEIVTNGIDDTRPWKDMGCIIFSQYYDSAHFIAEGLRIAEELFVREVTVKTHLNSIYRKLSVDNRVQAVLLAQQTEII